MNIKYIILVIFVSLTLQTSCSDDNSEPKGTITITVNTASDIWGYPFFTGSTCTSSFNGDATGTWLYPLVGGDGVPSDEDSLYDDAIPESEAGDGINVVYLYATIGDDSKSYPVLYKGESAANNSTITIDKIEPGTYYVVAFYDYCAGGNLENILNRYDRYAIYTAGTPYGGTANSTPFQDMATSIEIDENTTEITLEIKRDWVLGKPKTSTLSQGRVFLKSTDPFPVP